MPLMSSVTSEAVYAKSFLASPDIWTFSPDIWLNLTAALCRTFWKFAGHVRRVRRTSRTLLKKFFIRPKKKLVVFPLTRSTLFLVNLGLSGNTTFFLFGLIIPKEQKQNLSFVVTLNIECNSVKDYFLYKRSLSYQKKGGLGHNYTNNSFGMLTTMVLRWISAWCR